MIHHTSYVTVTCNGCGQEGRIAAPNEVELVAKLQQVGWICSSVHVCPTCKRVLDSLDLPYPD